MTGLKIIIIILAAAIIQTTIMDQFSFSLIKPDLFLIIAVYLGLSSGKITGTAAGFMAGLLQDILSGGLLGVNSLSKGLGSLFCSIVKNRLAGRNIISQFILIYALTISDGLFAQLVSFIAYKNSIPLKHLVSSLIWLAFFNSMMGCLLIYFLLSRSEINGNRRAKVRSYTWPTSW